MTCTLSGSSSMVRWMASVKDRDSGTRVVDKLTTLVVASVSMVIFRHSC